jgi:hypothetical protein
MKKLTAILIIISLTSCVSDYDRINNAKKKFPNAVVTPSTGMIKRNGYEITIEDTLTHQIYAISYYPFSENKISSIINIR